MERLGGGYLRVGIAIFALVPCLASAIPLALEAQEKRDLSALAAPEKDPWRIVDELAAAGRADEAVALARSVKGKNAAALLRYAENPPPEEPKVRIALADAERLLGAGESQKALAALDGLEPNPKSVLAYRVHALRGRLLHEHGHSTETGRECGKARAAAAAIGRDLDAEGAELLVRFGPFAERDDYLGLESVVLALRENFRVREAWDEVANFEFNLGAIYLNLGLPDVALRHLVRAELMLADYVGQAPRYGRLLGHVKVALCAAFTRIGRPAQALPHGEGAVALLTEHGDPSDAAYALRELANGYSFFGGHEEALGLIRRAQKLVGGDTPLERLDHARLRINEANALTEIGESGKAREILSDCIETLRGLSGDAEVVVALLNLGEALERGGEWGEAEARHREALVLTEGDPVFAAYCRVKLGDAIGRRGASREKKRLLTAKGEYTTALAALETLTESRLEVLTRIGLGEADLALGRPEAALDSARAAMTLRERMTGGLADGDVVEALSREDDRRLHRLGIRAAIAAKDDDALFEMLERSRGQAFLEALGGRRSLLGWHPPEAGTAETERLRFAEAVAYRDQRSALAANDREAFRAAQVRLEEARKSLETHLRRIERNVKGIARVTRPGIATIEQTQASLRPGEVIVLYALLPEASVALVVSKDSVRSARLEDQAGIEDAISALGAESSERPAAEVYGALDRIGALLIEPLKLPGKTRTVLVSPDGILTHLPWPVLVDRAVGPEAGAALVPSATVGHHLLANRERSGKKRVVLGNPAYALSEDDPRLKVYTGGRAFKLTSLPETEAEAKALARKGDLLLLAEGATAANLRGAIDRAAPLSALHLACHGCLDRRRPSLSALALAPGEGDDGFLTAGEIYQMRVPADLVTLSACETARDRTASGEGMLGLTRAFLLAGTRRVVASLWRVDDAATREFMIGFYEAWSETDVSTVEALRRARRRVENHEKWSHPAYWAGWVLWGVPD